MIGSKLKQSKFLRLVVNDTTPNLRLIPSFATIRGNTIDDLRSFERFGDFERNLFCPGSEAIILWKKTG